MKTVLGLAAAAALMVGTTSAFAQGAAQATAEMRDSNGQPVGTATLMQDGDGVRITAQLRNLPPGQHGIHLHAVGKCDAPEFMTAGGHFNPGSKQHGLNNPQGSHGGDMPNLDVGANGTATFSYRDTMVTLGSGANSLFDGDGTALVIHANADDQITDPTGNSGGRIACGVLARAAGGGSGSPAGLPSTGSVASTMATAVPAALAGLAALGLGIVLRRRR